MVESTLLYFYFTTNSEDTYWYLFILSCKFKPNKCLNENKNKFGSICNIEVKPVLKTMILCLINK